MPNRESLQKRLGLKKALRVRARVASSKKYSDGGLGYTAGTTQERAQAKTLGVSVLRVGYADGFFRKSENGMDDGQLGTLCMDAQIRVGKGKKGEWLDVMTDAALAAEIAGTISYEILCCVGKRGERVYIFNG